MSQCKECSRLVAQPTCIEPHARLVEDLPRPPELHLRAFVCHGCGARWQRDMSTPMNYWTTLEEAAA
jgi:hypothetical protein